MPSDVPPGPPNAPPRPGPPTIINPALRRQWVREEPAAAPQGRSAPRQASGSTAWALMFAIVVVAGVVAIRMTRPPEPITPEIAPIAAAGPAAPVVVPIPPADANLVRLLGAGAANRAAGEAMRVGQVSAQAVICGNQPAAWLAQARDGWADAATLRFPSFEESSQAASLLKVYLMVVFRAGQEQGEKEIAARGKDVVCADIAGSPDYQAAARAVGR